MEIIGEFVNPVENVAKWVLGNLGITKTNFTEHPYVNSHFNNIRNGILDANINFDGDIKRYSHHALTRAIEIAQIEGDNSKISIPYAVAWGIVSNDSIFSMVDENKLRYLLDRTLDFPILEYTQKKLDIIRDIELGIVRRVLTQDKIEALNNAIATCQKFQGLLRDKVSSKAAKELL